MLSTAVVNDALSGIMDLWTIIALIILGPDVKN